MQQKSLNFDLVAFIAEVKRLSFPEDDAPGYERRLLIALLRAADALMASGKEVRLVNGFRIFSIKRTHLVDYAGSDARLSSATLDRCIDHLKRRGHAFVSIPDLEERPENSSRPLMFAIDMEKLKEAVAGLEDEPPATLQQRDQVDDVAAWAAAQRRLSSSSPPSSSSASSSSSSSSPSSSSADAPSTSIKSPESISKNTSYSSEGRKNRETRPGPAVPWVSDTQLRSETGVMAFVDQIRALEGVCDELGALHGVDVDTPGELEAFILAITLNLVRQKAKAAEHVKRGRKPIGSVAAVLVTLLKTGEDGDGNSCRYHADSCLDEAKKFWRQKFGAKRGSDLGKLPTDEQGTREFESRRDAAIRELRAKQAAGGSVAVITEERASDE